jgi:hypothetical protein
MEILQKFDFVLNREEELFWLNYVLVLVDSDMFHFDPYNLNVLKYIINVTKMFQFHVLLLEVKFLYVNERNILKAFKNEI